MATYKDVTLQSKDGSKTYYPYTETSLVKDSETGKTVKEELGTLSENVTELLQSLIKKILNFTFPEGGLSSTTNILKVHFKAGTPFNVSYYDTTKAGYFTPQMYFHYADGTKVAKGFIPSPANFTEEKDVVGISAYMAASSSRVGDLVELSAWNDNNINDRLSKVELQNTNMSAFDSGIFNIKDYQKYKALSRLSNFTIKVPGGVNRIETLSLTQLYKDGSKLVVIFNCNDKVSGSIYSQSFVFRVDLGVEDVCTSSPVIDGIRYDAEIKVNAIDYSDDEKIALYALDSHRIYVNDEKIKELKLVTRYIFETGEEMSASRVRYARLGNYDYNLEGGRGYVCQNVGSLVQPRLIECDRKDEIGLFQCIDSKGRFLFWNNTIKKIMALDKWDDDTPYLLYDLTALNSDFVLGRFIFLMQNGNLLIVGQPTGSTDDDTPMSLYVLDTKNNTLTKTYTARSTRIRPLTRGCIAQYGELIFYSEYGSRGIATKLWRSSDYGMTWTEVHDFKNEPNVDVDGIHVHAVFYDAYMSRVWVTTGDTITTDGRCCKRIWWSDDKGETFKYQDFAHIYGPSIDPNDTAQLFTGYAGKDFMLFGGDDWNNCIYRSIRKEDGVVLDRVYKYNSSVSNKVTQYSGVIKRLSNGLVVFPLVTGDAGNFPQRTRLMGTFDGIWWYELFTDKANSVKLPIANDGIVEERDGYLYFAYVSADDVSGRQQITHIAKFLLPEVS